ncbi:MAG: hypothetical protein ACLUVF_01945 [Adlercreutzia sp.]
MAKPHGSVRIGPISLFALIIVLCLAVLTVLSVTTSLAELSTTERQAATTTETYQLEAVGQQFVADVDAALAEGTLRRSAALQRFDCPRRRAHLGHVLDGKRSHAGHRAADSKRYLHH